MKLFKSLIIPVSFLIALGTALLLASISHDAVVAEEKWPPLTLDSDHQTLVKSSLNTYKQKKINYQINIADYTPSGDYLNYGVRGLKRFANSRTQIDEEGIPKVQYGQEYYYNPVTVAQYALAAHGTYIGGEDANRVQFLKAADRLLVLQDESGAFRYSFPWTYYLTGETFKPGWVSGMAQGQALSVLSRAYLLTGNNKYLRAGDKALKFMVTPVSEGGTLDSLEDIDPSLKNYLIFEEYISKPASYTLNGFMFSLLGLYDWWQLEPSQNEGAHNLAKKYFSEGIKTLEHILPYFDLNGFTAYDLGHITYQKAPYVGIPYHSVHIYLLHALYSVTQNPWFRYCEFVWSSYVD